MFGDSAPDSLTGLQVYCCWHPEQCPTQEKADVCIHDGSHVDGLVLPSRGLIRLIHYSEYALDFDLAQTSDLPERGPAKEDPTVPLKDPGVLLKDTGVLLKNPGVL